MAKDKRVWILLEAGEGLSDDVENLSDVLVGVYSSESRAIGRAMKLTDEQWVEYEKLLAEAGEKSPVKFHPDGSISIYDYLIISREVNQ